MDASQGTAAQASAEASWVGGVGVASSSPLSTDSVEPGGAAGGSNQLRARVAAGRYKRHSK